LAFIEGIMNIKEIALDIVRPTLYGIGLWSEAAEQLVLGTGLVESGYETIEQDRGPAVSFWQIEEVTYDDCWNNYLKGQPWSGRLKSYAINLWCLKEYPDFTQLKGNFYLACAMCRVIYERKPAPLPQAGDLQAMADYWKEWYNTPLGAGHPADFVGRAAACVKPETWSR